MQKQFYISCMKINGIPLLPPMMTDTIKEEMRHYKSLAIKIEENLRDRRLVKHTIQDKCMQAVILEPIDMLKNIRYSSDSDISTRDIASDTNNKDSYSKMTIVEPLLQVEGETKDSHDIQSSISDVQHLQLQVCLANDINDSKLTAAVTDRNSVDAIETATPDEDVTLLENWKPEIPKTLNVLPITLSKVEEDTSSIEISKETPENLPKLSRQGSYILDTPSPILLAHMHTKLTDEKYIPTPTTNVSQLKQWNIAQPKAEWENKQFMVEHIQDLSKLECTPKQSTSQYRESDDSTESHQANKSTNCTKMVIVEEDTSKSDAIPIKHNHRYNTDFKKQSSLEKLEKNSDIGVLNLLSSKYTEDTNSPKIQLSYIDEGLHNKKENIVEYHDSANKTKSSTPNKLLMVYKEIEEMHKKQMMELIYRQRKEQSLLQAEFQKQQILLLAEIQKCASGISHQTNALNVALNRSLSSDEAKPTSHEARQQMDTDSPSNIHTEMDYNIKLPSANRMIVCPLDYISSKNLHLLKYQSFFADDSSATLDFDFTRKVSLYDTMHNNNNNNNTNNNNNNNNNNNGNDDNSRCESRDLVRKNSNVSRQLFPLDSNTTHIPVLDTIVYFDKHVQAVNTINAYTRGYLIRRLMRTERVITLKKIYKEALQCMLKLHVDAPLNLAEVEFLHRLQLQCDAASMNIVELFAQSPTKRMKIIAHDREIKESRTERPTSARSYSFATQKTLARKNLKEFESTMAKYQQPSTVKRNLVRSRCQTWTSDIRDRLMSPNALYRGIRRSTSTGAVRKPWR
ncbi:PREDICTED: putative uncharacterized protein DDB_G0277255 [Acromyrmex echinatior]|uniref:putative uncharacterized protein DDB_G0277255 n=1 Tax=Acromyrmex echinatior TaxID=103372 RepID=UPI000580F50D|nr:PREDICTED: putative uncharacterized protein DDB_G0277255 [Acromyrmex echinatior]XP_011050929.1 PREDICTED: putative uncharacterized protein DDB_G0277255 [Acromyrmex echinatior]XP_011050930.1 PREDICTED: putative uncharacterized protein DDB_G0277255 [Acromyrmex echinatior]